uniref:Putative transposase, MuDR, plant n=1 Tax=Helianthus annuus TaxID=4232 RepID=A0A251UHI7_HELAN
MIEEFKLWIMRHPGTHFDPIQAYGQNPSIFTLRINHGGWFTSSPGRRYFDGEVSFIDWVDEDKFSVHELNDMMVKIGYPLDEKIYYHFMIPDQDLDYGLRAVGNDSDVSNMLQYVQKFKVIDLYTEHWMTTLDNHFQSPCKVVIQELNDEQGPANQVRRTLAIQWYKNDDKGSSEGGASSKGGDGAKGSAGSEGGEGVEDSATSEDSDGSEGSDDSDDSDFLVDEENAIDHYEVDMQNFRAAVDMNFDEEALANQTEDAEHIDDFDLDNFDSLSDEENDTTLKKKLREHRKKKRHGNVLVAERFYVGQQFADREQIKKLVKTHAIETRRQLKVVRNDLGRFRVICEGVIMVGGAKRKVQNSGGSHKKNQIPCCPWILHVSNPNNEGTWVVKTNVSRGIYDQLGVDRVTM